MTETVEWMADGTPYSPSFQDRYHSESGGLDQARLVFLQACGLPEAWANQAQWCVLETGFGFGLNFLVTWDAWRRDPARPHMLHFVSVEAWPVLASDLLRMAAASTELRPLAEQLAAQFWGLQPGVHRLSFEGGQVLLTLCIGDAQAMLRDYPCQADSVYLDGFSPDQNPDIWSLHTLKAVARNCRIGARVATWTVARSVRDALAQAGFVVHKTPGVPPKRDNLQGAYTPHWTPRQSVATSEPAWTGSPGKCVVIGAGISGASVAASLARRGWQVLVLDTAEHPAAGASGLPAGLFAPHVSGDDNLVSRITRSGLRATRQQAQTLLREGVDWAPSGVLQHQADGPIKKLAHTDAASADWSRPALSEQLSQATLPTDGLPAQAHWHPKAGWLRPAALVRALLATPNVTWQGAAQVTRLERVSGTWQVFGAQDQLLAEVPLVVLATAFGTRQFTQDDLPLNALRGQVSWGWQDVAPPAAALPFPVNGLGSYISNVPYEAHAARDTDAAPSAPQMWVTGATYERGCAEPVLRFEDHAANFGKLQTLLPSVAASLQAAFDADAVQAWAGVRCTYPDRLPLVGPLDPEAQPGLWVSTAMGSRGLTLAVLCGELLAARLHGEPLPLLPKLAAALDSMRAFKKS
jgi:tRNA 5-methylaminomethyl-2-thiouridine biosynthesis bifunctional protein